MKAPSRAVRVFLPSDLKEYVLKKGYLRLHFSVHGVRPYVPPTFYCNHCKRMGAHSTKFHRFPSEATQELGGRRPTSPP